ncbi:MAG: tandem-95 repeat protein [candidate division Zixibacteria bacterium]|nr:tandem-95 repeat protein [candidate division Zixibacteria bacterium]
MKIKAFLLWTILFIMAFCQFAYAQTNAPVLDPIGAQLIDEGAHLELIITSSDIDGDSLILTVENLPTNAAFIDSGNGHGLFTFDPDFTQGGLVSVRFIVTDTTALADTELVDITINNINRAPVLDPIGALVVNEGDNLEITITSSDADLDFLFITAENMPANASIADGSDGTALFGFDPDFTQSGVDTVLFIVRDGTLADSEYVRITVNNVNRAPVLDPIGALVVNEGDNLEITITSSDVDLDFLFITAENMPANASIADGSDGTALFGFDPDFTQSGVDTVLFIVSDGSLADSEYVQITINNVNAAPALDPIGAQVIDEGAHLEFVATSSDLDPDVLTLTAENLPTNAAFTDSGNGHGLFTFDPDYTQNGFYPVRLIVNDGTLADTEMVNITVNRVNIAPVLDPVSQQFVDEGQHIEIVVTSSDLNNDGLSLNVENMPANSAFTDSGNGHGLFTFDPDFSQSGDHSIRIIANDGELADTGLIDITVNHVNLAPALNPLTAQIIDENSHFEYLVSATDFDNDLLALSIDSSPINSAFFDSGNGNGLFTFDPGYTQSGVYNVRFIVEDAALADTGFLQITVTDINAPPVIDPISPQVVDEGQSLGLVITSSDIDGPNPTLTAEDLPTNAAFTDSGNGHGLLSFDPDYTQSGGYQIRLIAGDGALADTALVDITVNHVNIAPVVDPIGIQTVDEGGHLEYVVTSSDFDGDALTLSMYNFPSNATFTDSGNGHGLYTFDPDFTQEGGYSVMFVANDGALADTVAMPVTVNHYNTTPVLDPIGSQVVNEGDLLSVHVTSADSESDLLIYTVENIPANAAFEDSGNGSGLFTFNPDYFQTGQFNVRFIISDSEFADSEMVQIDVINTNRSPIFDHIGSQALNEGEHLEFVVNSTEPDLEAITLTVENIPVNATFTDSGNGNGLFTFDPDFTQSDVYIVRFIASDGLLADTAFSDIVVSNINIVPVLDPIGGQVMGEGESLGLYITSSDFDNTTLTLTAEGLPSANAAFTDSGNGNGLFTFDPDFSQSGVYPVLFIVDDGELADSELVQITVNEINLSPVLAAVTTPQTLDENQVLQFNLSASDPDGVIPSLTAYNVPANATMVDSGNGNGTFTFSPDYFQAGTYNIIFEAFDGDLADSQEVEITVNNIDRPPTLAIVAGQTVDEGQHLEFLVTATDPDLEILILTAQNVMPNAAFSDSGNNVGLFEFDPDFTQAGNYIVRFIADDGEISDTIYVDVTVNALNAAPILGLIPTPQVVGEEDTLIVLITANDPDGTTPTLTAENLPTNASFADSGDGTGGLYFYPVYGQAGGYDLLFFTSDGEFDDSQYVHLDVVITNSPPVIAPVDSQSVVEGGTLNLVITATDPDLTDPFLTASGLPLNAAFTDSGNGHGLLEFMPGFDQEGDYTVTIIASDGSLSDTGDVYITVLHGNVAPVWDPTGPQTVDEGDHLDLVVSSMDFDLDILSLTTETLPINAAFTDSGNGHGLLTFDPDMTQSGSYQVNFFVDDGSLTDTMAVDITVNHVNIRPGLNAIGPQSVDEGVHLEFTANAVDFDGDPLTLSAENLPTNADFTDGGSGSGLFTFDPEFTQDGVYSVLIIAGDGDLADSELVDITVNNINIAPVIDPTSAQILGEGDHLEFVVTASDFDPDLLTLSAEDVPVNAAFVDSGNGHGLFTFDPDFTQSGPFTVRFIISDGSLADTGLVDITVNHINVGPVLDPIGAQVVDENGNLEFVITASDFDLDGLTLSAEDLPTNAAFTDSGNGHGLFSFNPDYTQAGVYTVRFIVGDAELADTELVDITVNHINIAPVLDPVSAQILNEGQHLEIVMTSSDFDNDALTLTASSLPTNAAFDDSGNGHGLFTFDPDFTQDGSYLVTIIVNDGNLADTGYIDITVNNFNLTPIITPLSDQPVDENDILSFVVFATDPDGVIPSLSAFDLPSNATFNDFGTGSGLFEFSPDYTQSGIYDIGFVASDGEFADTEMVQITVNHINLAPVLNPIGPQIVDEGDLLEFAVVSSDFDGDLLVLTGLNLPSNSTFIDSGNGHGSLSFAPDHNQSGGYTVRFITDDGSLADTIDVSLTVNNMNRSPILGILADRSVDEDNFLSFVISASDPDGAIPGLSAFDMPANALLEDYGNGTALFTFSPDFSQSGIYDIGFVASDGELADTGFVQITVNHVNLPPTLDPILPQAVEEGGHLEFVVTSSDYDVDMLTLIAEDFPLNSSFTDSGNSHGLFTFDPAFDQEGIYYVRFIVSDGTLADSQLVSISVGQTNQPPVGSPIADQFVDEKAVLNFSVGFTDPDGQLLSLSSFNRPNNGTFVDNGNNTGQFEFRPDSSQSGIYSVGFIGFDGSLADTIFANITVNDFNVAPVLNPIPTPLSVGEGGSLQFSINASDYDSNPINLSTSTLPTNAAFVDSGNGTGRFTFNPDYNQSGSYDIWFYAADASLTDSQLVRVDVVESNLPPVLTTIADQFIDEGTTLEFTVEATDPDGQIPALTVENLPVNAAFIDSGNGHGLFTFNPDYTQSSVYNIRFIAGDGALADTELVDITVNHINIAPVLDPIGSQVINEADHLEFIVTSSDFDLDGLTLIIEDIPLNAAFTDSGNGVGLFTFDPDYSQSGIYPVRFIVSDGALADTESVDITVNHINVDPILDPIGNRSVAEGGHLEFTVTSSDFDLDLLTLTAEDLPTNASFADSGNGHGLFVFDPDLTQSGDFTIRFIVSDGVIADSENVIVSVNQVNVAPVLDPVGPQAVDEGDHLEMVVTSSDFDLDAITLTAVNLPANASFADSGNGHGLFIFDPDFTQSGLVQVTLIANDGQAADSEAVDITVNNINLPPEITPVSDQSVEEDDFLSFVVSASDPDGVTPSLTIFDMPVNATFNDLGNGSGLFEFSPDFTQSGIFDVGFVAFDGALADTEMVQITVGQINIAPVIAAIIDQNVDEGNHLEFVISSSDFDSDPITLTALSMPVNSTFDDSGNGNGLFTFDPDFTQSGNYTVRFIAGDGSLTDTLDVDITVNNVNLAPAMGALTDRAVDEDDYLSFVVSASDPDGEIPFLSAFNMPANAAFEDYGSGAGLFTFSPDYSQAGIYDVGFVAFDGELADTGYVQVTVNHVNLAPELDPILPQSVEEGGHLELVVTSSDFDLDALFLTAQNLPANSSFADSGNGHGLFTFDPAFDQDGVYYVRFIIYDGSLSDSQLVSISVGQTNQSPVGDPIVDQSVDEKDVLQLTVNFTDPDGQLLNLIALNLPSNSTFDDNGNNTGLFEFIPDSTQAGFYTVGFVGFDGSLADTVYTNITVNDVNVAPVLNPIPTPLSVSEGGVLQFSVSAADFDANPIALSTSTLPANAAFVDSGNGNGHFTFSPDFSQSGSYSIWFYASDTSLTDSQLVQVNVVESNLPPELTAIGPQSVDEGAYLEFIVEGSDPDGQALTLLAENVPVNAVFTDSGNGHGLFAFSPDYSQSGAFAVRFIVSDGDLADTEMVDITVNTVNLAPVLDPIGGQSVDEASHLEFVITASDNDLDALTLTAENLPSGAAFIDSTNGHGLFTFDPSYLQSGDYPVTFIVTDGVLADTELVSITVVDINITPVLDPIGAQAVDENQVLEFAVTSSDINGDALVLSAEDLPVNSAFVDSGNGYGSLVFAPDYTQAGVYQVRFIVADSVLADTELVDITVNNYNIRPALSSLANQSVAEGGHLELAVSAVDFDGDPLTLSADNLPANAAFVDSGDNSGSFTFDPDFTQGGIYDVTFIASDGDLADSAVVQITVTGTNLPPVINPISDKIVNEGAYLSFVVTATDPDSDVPSLTVFDTPVNTTFEDYGNGTALFTFSPDSTQAGIYDIGFIAYDGALVDTEMVQITVNQVNIAPVFVSVPAQVVEEGSHLEYVIESTDFDSDPLTLTALNLPTNAALTDSGNGHGLVSFDPSFGQSGTYIMIFITSDGSGADTLNVTVTVNNFNLPPELGALTDRIIDEDDYLSFLVSATDPDGQIPSLTSFDLPSNATMEDYGNGAGLFTFSPDFTQAGVYDIGFVANDGELTDTGYVQITVNQVNLAPILSPIIPQSVEEGGHLEFVVISSDFDLDALSLIAQNLPANSSFDDSGNGHGLFTFDPAFDQDGVYYVQFIVDDGALADSQLVSISVGQTNQAPVGDPISDQFVDEGNTLQFMVSFVDPDGQLLSLTSFNRPTNSSFVDNGNNTGLFEFDPDSSQAGLYSVGFVGFDGSLADTIFANIDVADINVAPVLTFIPTPQTVAEGGLIEFNISASDFDGNSITLSTSTLPTNAVFDDSGNGVGTFGFSPDYGQSGSYDIWFYASDASLTDSQIVRINVVEFNLPPELAAIGPQSVDEGAYLGFTIAATDPDGPFPSLIAEDIPVNAAFIDSGNGHGLFTFSPDFTQSGVFTVRFIASDGELADTESVDITVNHINQSPVFDPISDQYIGEGEHLEFVMTATDFDLDVLILLAEDLPSNAAFSDSGNGHGLFTFDPDYSQGGIYPVRFIAGDGDLADTEMVNIIVADINNPPVLDSIGSKTVVEDELLSFIVTASDINGDALTLSAENIPINSVFVDSGNGHGSFAFTPDHSQAGDYQVRFIVNDGASADTELVVITVINDNIAPSFFPVADRIMNEGAHLQFTVSAVDFDGDPLTMSAINMPANSAFNDNGNNSGSFGFDPDYTQSGIYDITFIANDGDLADSEVVQITVNDFNLPPQITSVGDRVLDEGAYLSFIVVATDPDGDVPSLTIFDSPVNSTFEDYGNGTALFTFSPDSTQAGIYNVGFIANDGALVDTEMVEITVDQVNIAPEFVSVPAQVVVEGDHLEFVIESSDFDNDPLTLSALNLPANAALVDSGNGHGLVVFDPDFDQSGTYIVTFVSSDGGLADTIDVTVTVNNSNLSPILGSLPSRIIDENEYLSFVVSAIDPDGQIPSLIALDLPANASMEDYGNGTGLFTFLPDYTQSGVYDIGFVASDGELADTGYANITVNQINLPPVLDQILPQSVEEGGHLEVLVGSSDFDLDQLFLSAENIPTNATFVDSGNGHGLFVFDPTFDQEDIYYVRFIVSDGDLADSQLVSVSVGGMNQPPVGDSIPDQLVDEQASLSFTVYFSDPDGQLLALSAFNMPANSTFDDNGNGTGIFEYLPDSSQADIYVPGFLAFDGSLADTVYANITVNDVNVAPILDLIQSPQVAVEGETLEFGVNASDYDGNALTLSTSTLPANAAFTDSGNSAGSFTFSPDFTQSGDYDIWFVAADTALADSQLVRISVVENNLPPELTTIDPQTVNEGDTLELIVVATDPDGQALGLSAEDIPSNAAFVDSGNGHGLFTFIPDYTQEGGYIVRFIASDGNLADSIQVNITVNHVNLAPALDPIGSRTVDEGAHLEFVVTGSDFDLDALTLFVEDIPANASFADSSNGHGLFLFDPDYSQAGDHILRFIVSDSDLADTELVVITVQSTNLLPVIDPLTDQVIDEGTHLELQVSASDNDNDSLILAAFNMPVNATFDDSGNGYGGFIFDPDYTQAGTYDILFTVSDGVNEDSTWLNITVNNVNLPVVLDPIPTPLNINENELVEFTITASDPDGIPTLVAENLPANSVFTDLENGSGYFAFAPDYYQSGSYPILFIAGDGELADSQQVDINVADVNLPPILDPIGSQTVSEANLLGLDITASDIDDDSPAISAENMPSGATIVDNGDGTARFEYTPDYGDAGIYNVTFIAGDDQYADSELVEITVLVSNRSPQWDPIPDYSMQEGGILVFYAFATDPDSVMPALSVANLPLNATFVDSGNGFGWFRFEPDYTQSGIYDLEFLASDGELIDTAIVRITVDESGNQPPDIDPVGPQVVDEDQHLEFTISAIDPEGSIPLLAAFNMPDNAGFTDNGNGTGLFTFDPDFFQSGSYIVRFIAFDGQLADTELVTISVIDVGFPPVLTPIGPQTVVEGGSLEIIISATDPDLTIPTLIAENLPGFASFTDSLNGNGLFVFTPDYTQSGVDTVLFIASDGDLADSEYVIITIFEFGNVTPVLYPIGDQIIDEGDTLSLIVSAADPDSTIPDIFAENLPANAVFIDMQDGTAQFDFNPDFLQDGVYTILVYASDGEFADSEYVEITVNDRNGPPILIDIGPQTVGEGDSLGIALAAIDPDGDAVSFGTDDLPENAYLVDAGNGTAVFNFLPDYTQSGSYNVTIFATDGVGADSELVAITVVEAGNQAPQFDPVDSLIAVVEGDSLGVIISAFDPDGDPINFTSSPLPFNAGFEILTSDSLLFYFMPDYNQAGSYAITVTAADGTVSTDLILNISVLESGSLPPAFDPVDPQVVDEGDTLSLTVTAIDIDGTIPPRITINNQHPRSEFIDNGDGSATYTYMPDYYDAGIDTVVFIAIDTDDLQDILEVEITTGEFNIAPILAYDGDSVAIQGDEMEAVLIATDSTDGNGGPIYLSALYLPANSDFVDNGDYTGSFTFTPDYDQIGQDSAIFIAVDSDNPPLSMTITVHLEIRNQNRAPVWDPIDAYDIDQADTLNVPISASDPDGDTLIFRFTESPPPPRNASIIDNGDGTGELIFSPDYTQTGVFMINIEAYDLLDAAVAQAFVFVNDLGNQTPTLNYIPDMSMVEGETLQVSISATDPDSTFPALFIGSYPYRLQFTDNGDGTADIYFEPLYNQAGIYDLLIYATDTDGAADSQHVELNVIEAGNQIPWIGFITDRVLNEGESISFPITATDPDSTTPFLDVEVLPDNATFIDNHNGTGLFLFNPDYFQAGEHTINFLATDAEDSSLVASRSMMITVNNVNRAPEIDSIGPFSVYEGDSLGFLVTAIDPDSTYPIIQQGLNPPENSVFHDSGNGVAYFSFEPDYFQSGLNMVTFIARDIEDTTVYDYTIVAVNVLDFNRPPVFDPLPADTSIQDGVHFVLQTSASDPDSVIPDMFAHDMPSGAIFIDNNDGTATFNFIPDFGDLGDYFITFGCYDGTNPAMADSQTIRIEVISTGLHPPQFQPIDTLYGIEPGTLISFTMETVDVDGGQIVLSYLDALPGGAIFTDNGDGSAVFSWVPDSIDAGIHLIRFMATDETDLSDTLRMRIEVITWVRGDANGDGSLLGSDVTYLVLFFRGEQPRPYPEGRGDANGDGHILGSDVTYLVNYFRGAGPPPPPGPGPGPRSGSGNSVRE